MTVLQANLLLPANKFLPLHTLNQSVAKQQNQEQKIGSKKKHFSVR